MIYDTARHSLWHPLLTLIICAGIFAHHTTLAAEVKPQTSNPSITETVSDDYKEFYSKNRLIRMGIVFGVAGVAANTNIDMNIRNWYQDKVRNAQTYSWSSDPVTSYLSMRNSLGKACIWCLLHYSPQASTTSALTPP